MKVTGLLSPQSALHGLIGAWPAQKEAACSWSEVEKGAPRSRILGMRFFGSPGIHS